MNLLARGLGISKTPVLQFGKVPGLWIQPRHRIVQRSLDHYKKEYRVYADQSGMDEVRAHLVNGIHGSEEKLVLYATGGGAHVRR